MFDQTERAEDPESVIRAIHLWNDRKRRIMKPDHNRVAWNRLQDLGWLGQDSSSP